MKIILLFFLYSVSQFIIAGQFHEIDIAKEHQCQKYYRIYSGDTVRFINRSTTISKTIKSTEFYYPDLNPGGYFDYTFIPNSNNQYLAPSKVSIPYTCENPDDSAFLVIRAAPITIYPKEYLLSTDDEFNIGIYILSDEHGNYDSDILQLSITVDGVIFFKGNTDDYKKFLFKEIGINFYTYVLNNCDIKDDFNPSCIGEKGYMVTQFSIPAGFLKIGKHIIRIKLTLDTPIGNADYEDKAEYFIMDAQR